MSTDVRDLCELEYHYLRKKIVSSICYVRDILTNPSVFRRQLDEAKDEKYRFVNTVSIHTNHVIVRSRTRSSVLPRYGRHLISSLVFGTSVGIQTSPPEQEAAVFLREPGEDTVVLVGSVMILSWVINVAPIGGRACVGGVERVQSRGWEGCG